MSLFKGITMVDLLGGQERVLIAVLSEELARTNQAVEALAEEVKALKAAKGEPLKYNKFAYPQNDNKENKE